MSYLSLFMLSFGVTIGAVISPGPISTTVVTEGARRGFRTGPLVSTGHALTELVMVGALVLGMGQALEHPVLAAANRRGNFSAIGQGPSALLPNDLLEVDGGRLRGG